MSRLPIIVLLLGASRAMASGASPAPGSIRGHVYDQREQPLAGVKVSARLETGKADAATALTDRAGGFLLTPLAPGRYAVTAAARGLRSRVQRGVVVAPGAVVELKLVLEVAASAESVSVVEKAPIISTTVPNLRETYNMDFVESMPMATRDRMFTTDGFAMRPRAEGTAARGTGRQPAPAGILTAGLWDDNANFDHYQRYLREFEAQQPGGLVAIPRSDRVAIDVVDAAGLVVSGAEVTVRVAGARPFHTITPADGRVWYFPGWMGADPRAPREVAARAGGQVAHLRFGPTATQLRVRLEGRVAATPRALDLVFLIDTTGSMGDEIHYLQTELDSIVGTVARSYPWVQPRLALVVYRDDGDAYVVNSHDFTSDLAAFKRILAQQSAGGGGDEPEAAERGLAAAAALSWRAGRAARTIFWLADAPHHEGREAAMAAAILGVLSRGVRVYPVASSGTNALAEHTLRTAAEVTGGRYLFLTDDSGVGLPHGEPKIPCYYVTSLQAAMSRVLSVELTGRHLEPAPHEVLRTGGDPQHARCPRPGGRTLVAF
jgi:hypothetical protein